MYATSKGLAAALALALAVSACAGGSGPRAQDAFADYAWIGRGLDVLFDGEFTDCGTYSSSLPSADKHWRLRCVRRALAGDRPFVLGFVGGNNFDAGYEAAVFRASDGTLGHVGRGFGNDEDVFWVGSFERLTIADTPPDDDSMPYDDSEAVADPALSQRLKSAIWPPLPTEP